MKRNYLKKISSYSIVGGLGASLILGLVGCESSGFGSAQGGSAQNSQDNISRDGAFVIIEKDSFGNYKILEEFPSKETRVVLRENGVDRILSQAEIDEIIALENRKIEDGTSDLLKPPEEVSSGGGGMGLGGAILASAAGAILGSYIGNRLFNNQNYQAQRSTRYQNPSAFSRSADNFNNRATQTTKTQKSGFFGSQNKNTNSRSFGFGS